MFLLGYSIYPSQLEQAIRLHEKVAESYAIGVLDKNKGQKVKAIIKLKDGIEKTEELKKELFEHCRLYIAKYAIPYEIEFIDDFPLTLMGKIDYMSLTKNNIHK